MVEGRKVSPCSGSGEVGRPSPAAEGWSLSSRVALVLSTCLLASVWTLLIFVKLGSGAAESFFTAYLVEQSLSLDNLFVFLLVFRYFRVRPALQPVVLGYGLVVAMPLRALMILVGVEVIEKFRWLSLIFAAILMYSGGKILTGAEDDGEDEDLSGSTVVRLARMLVCGRVHPRLEGDRFFLKKDGKLLATPLIVCLFCVEISDVVFAVDSIPAVIGITGDVGMLVPSNILAICTVRSLFSLIAATVSELEYLEYASGLVLVYVGLEMGLGFFHIDVPAGVSFAVIVMLLGGGTLLSLYLRERTEASGDGANQGKQAQPDAEAPHAGDGRHVELGGVGFVDPDDAALPDDVAERRTLLAA